MASDASTASDADASADALASLADATDPKPAGSVPLEDAPDVRVELLASSKAIVKVGQTFGILVPHPPDFLDEWELEPKCPLGEPLTIISRGDLGLEHLFKIGEDKVGTHVVRLRLMHRKSRASSRVPTRRASVTVDVVR